MSTQNILGAIGAAIGLYVTGGSPAGAQWGYAIGSIVGGIVDPQKIQGPRLDDLSVAVSGYGQPIPRIWGGMRVACPVIWSVPLIETQRTDNGKGGPETTTYSYAASFAVSVAEGEIESLRRIWFDSKLVYDAREDASVEAQLASQDFAQYFVFYQGTEAQLPDPTIESYEGVGNVEPFRGTAYIVFTAVPVGDYGNRIPQVRVEVTDQTSEETETTYYEPQGLPRWRLNPVSGMPEPEPSDPEDSTGGPAEYWVTVPAVSGAASGPFYSLSAALASALANGDNSGGGLGGNALADVYLAWSTGTNTIPNCFSGGATLDDDPEYVNLIFGTVVPDIVTDDLLADSYLGCGACLAAGLGPYSEEVVFSKGSFIESSWRGLVSMAGFYGADFINNCFPTYGLLDPLPKSYGAKCNVISLRRLPRCDSKRCYSGDPTDYADGIAELPGAPEFCLSTTGEVSPNGDLEDYADTNAFKILNDDIFAGLLNTSTRYRIIPAQGPVIHESDARFNDEEFWTQAALNAAFPPPGLYSATGNDTGRWPVRATTVCRSIVQSNSVGVSCVPLSDIVRDICLDAGLLESQIDVTELTDCVQGYARGRVMPARSAIEPLRIAYFFDAVESSGVIKFVKRGHDPVRALTPEDLGAGTETPGTSLVISERQQEAELPNYVGVAYQSRAADYQTVVQQAKRRIGGSQQLVQIELPIVLDDDEAARIAEVVLYSAWAGRVKRSISLLLANADIEATDVVTASDGEITYRLRIVERQEQGSVLTFTAVDDDPATLVSVAVGGTPPTPTGEIAYDGPTLLLPIDAPLLRNEDASTPAGFYVGGNGYFSSWGGAEVFRSIDGGTSYSSATVIGTASVIGTALTALGDFGGGNAFDEENFVDVLLINGGTLSTATRDAVLNNANAAWLAGEVFQFRSAELISTGTYRLTGLLRGRLGTEDSMGAHAINDKFMLLSVSTLRRIGVSSASWGVESILKGVSAGTSLAAAYPVEFTNNGRGAMPLAPVHLGVGSAGGDGYVAQWVRRTKQAGVWANGRDVFLDESPESYRVRVLSGETVVMTTTTSSATATFGAGEDYSGLTLEVCQVSSLYGPGAAATATIP